MSAPLQRGGWKIYFHPLFSQQYQHLRQRARELKSKLSEADYKKHPEVKLFASLYSLINQTIPNDPLASYFALRGALKRFSRVKKMGLPQRYRLFFRADPMTSTIVILWLGYPRKEGDKKDCYRVFTKKVSKGEIPQTIEHLLAEIEGDNKFTT